MIGRSLLAALLLFLTPATAHAVRNCSLGGTPVVFGVFTGPSSESVGQISISCSGIGTVAYALTLSTGSSGTYSSRQMRNFGDTLSYNLFADPAHTQVFGDGTGGSTRVFGVIDARDMSTRFQQIYGKIPTQNLPRRGTYLDTITVTLHCDDRSCNDVTATFLVTATVLATCTISATNLVFGSYTQAQLDAQSQISVNCTRGTDWDVGLNEGNFPGATVLTRRMSGPGLSSLMYSLYRDGTRTLNWGNTIGINTVSSTGTGSSQNFPVFGRMPPSQPAAPGGYRDTIIATITF